MEFISQHKLVSVVLLLLLIAAAWWGFTSGVGPSALVSTNGPAAIATGTAQDAQLVSTLLQLQAVTLSGTILSNPEFLSLQDFTTQIVNEPVGRPNPFAPVSAGTPTSTSTAALNPNLFAPAKH